MKPKDALGELVKEWKEPARDLTMSSEIDEIQSAATLKNCADQLEKALEGKVVVDREEFVWLITDAIASALFIKNVDFLQRAKEMRGKYLIFKPKEPTP